MIKFLKNIFGFGKQEDIKKLMENEAVIIDVRTEKEFQGGHLKNSVNIPLDDLRKNLFRFDRTQPVIVCCASGIRSALAKNILKSNGFLEVCNGGCWTNLKNFEKN